MGAIEITEELSVKKALEKSQNVLEQKRKNGEPKILHKKSNTFEINAPNFVPENLIIRLICYLKINNL